MPTLLLLPLFVWAVDGPLVLTLDEVIERAFTHTVSLKKSAIDLETARYASKNVWSELLPGISAGGSARWGTGWANPPATPPDPTFGVQANLSLSLNAGIPAAMKITGIAYKTQLLDYERSRIQLKTNVTKEFYRLLTLQKNLEILNEKLKNTELQLQNDTVRFNNGTLNELNYQRSRVSVQTARLSFNQARSSFFNATAEFLYNLGYDENIPVEISGAIEIERIDLDAEILITKYLPQHPEIISALATIERLKLTALQRTLTARSPSISLSAGWSGTPAIGKDFSDSFSAGASISIPVEGWIPGTKSSQNIKSAAADTEKSRLDLQNTENAAKLAIRNAVENLHNSWSSIEIAREQATLAERAYDMARRGFSQGTVPFIDLETTRNSMAEAAQQLLNEEYRYKSFVLDLAAALNVDVEELLLMAR